MTLSQPIEKAEKVVRKHFDMSMDDDASEAWCLLRTELHRLSEIAESVEPLVIRLGEVTTRLEAANALLRECVDNREGLAYEAVLLARIQFHLQGPGR